mmetsp:Transcript_70033/g.192231  ORF Transcript_70033/g.192231 Transcript_70033/m.192231 type:complete len:246 (-) Transcript_70033:443-1180(-)
MGSVERGEAAGDGEGAAWGAAGEARPAKASVAFVESAPCCAVGPAVEETLSSMREAADVIERVALLYRVARAGRAISRWMAALIVFTLAWEASYSFGSVAAYWITATALHGASVGGQLTLLHYLATSVDSSARRKLREASAHGGVRSSITDSEYAESRRASVAGESKRGSLRSGRAHGSLRSSIARSSLRGSLASLVSVMRGSDRKEQPQAAPPSEASGFDRRPSHGLPAELRCTLGDASNVTQP